MTGTLHDLRAIDPKKKIAGGGGSLVRQRVEQGFQVMQPAFVEHLTEFPDERAKASLILLPPGRRAYVRPVAFAVDLK